MKYTIKAPDLDVIVGNQTFKKDEAVALVSMDCLHKDNYANLYNQVSKGNLVIFKDGEVSTIGTILMSRLIQLHIEGDIPDYTELKAEFLVWKEIKDMELGDSELEQLELLYQMTS